MLRQKLGAICASLITMFGVPCYAAGDQFPQEAQKMLDMLSARDGWKSHRCMIAPNLARDMVVGTHDTILNYGDKILEVEGRPVSSTGPAVVDLLRTLPVSATIKLRINRAGVEQTVSVPCSDAAPAEALTEDALVSAAKSDFPRCAEKFDASERLHELNWAQRSFQFQCQKRMKKSSFSDAHGLYGVDRDALRDNAFSSDTLQKLSKAISDDENRLRQMGSGYLADELKSEFEAYEFSARTTCATSPVKRAAFDFRGLHLGDCAPLASVEQGLQDKDAPDIRAKCASRANGLWACSGLTVIAGAVAEANAVIDSSGTLISLFLSIKSGDFERVAGAAQEKYGHPSYSSSETVQNRMGAKFANTTFVWGNEKASYIRASKYGDTLDKGFVYFGTIEDTALANRTEADARKRSSF